MNCPQEKEPCRLHRFKGDIAGIALPGKFTNPFRYTPHPLAQMAATEVQEYLSCREEWQAELRQGKMFGVLVVQTGKDELGYLAAFSGILAGINNHAFFVPPVYDLLNPDGFFKAEERNIDCINAEICRMQDSETCRNLQKQWEDARTNARATLEKAKAQLRESKQKRDLMRAASPDDPACMGALIRESQHQKAEFKRLKGRVENELSALQAQMDALNQEIATLKAERKARSAALQEKIFRQFRLLNGKGEIKDVFSIFQEAGAGIPPSGSGECAAPKLLQHAFLHGLRPVAMAEFWWGDSPRNEMRRHGFFYPACQSKCKPLLNHMLQGLEVDNPALPANGHYDTPLEILYEDPWLIAVHKPAGMLSVPGKIHVDSVAERLHALLPEAEGPLLVHRLDMETSGILLAAKTKCAYQNLQAQFRKHEIQKRYIAILDGDIAQQEGTIDLPIRPDPEDRPRQVVDHQWGKPAITRYKVLGHHGKQTIVAFCPVTGRTHQIRVHAAHPDGLDTPILGDELYGRKAERLFLHAEMLQFRHPATGETIRIEKKADFY